MNGMIGVTASCLGCGLAANVSGVAPSNYFKKRLPVAYGICMSGGAVGLLAIGPLTVQLLEMYNLSGALLILGAIAFNVCLAGALIRPPSTLMQEESMSIDLARQDDTEEICDAQGDPTMTMHSQHNVLTVESTTVKFEQRGGNHCSPANLPQIVKENSPGKRNETAESLLEHSSHLTTENSRSLIYESTGVYDFTFLFSGACFIISAFLALCIPLAKKPT
ncbi:monocarboxylate transporter 14-like [Haliotis rubra]|uniref:monocarboxylate transporter 14-like n=1 Tax=Haliotis rubra TaxID=36100 RepID=UPI001EE51A99|nr:monocarboxylate transporter 14-like [Haliotis rubra]